MKEQPYFSDSFLPSRYRLAVIIKGTIFEIGERCTLRVRHRLAYRGLRAPTQPQSPPTVDRLSGVLTLGRLLSPNLVRRPYALLFHEANIMHRKPR